MKKQEAETQALATVGTVALASVEEATKDSAEDLALNQQFEQADLRLPQMKVCQSMTPQRKRSDPNFIPNLAEGDLFNDASAAIYGQGPLRFVMLKFWTNFIKFKPVEQGGGILSRGIRGEDGLVRDEAGKILNTEFGPNGEKPDVTKFMNYLFYLVDTQEIVWFSAKSTALSVMRQFHTSLRGVQGIADYRKVFTISTASAKNAAQQEYAVPVIPKKPVGIIPADSELAKALRKMTSDLADKNIDTSAAETTDSEQSTEDVPF